MVIAKRSDHFVSFNDLQSRGCDRSGGPHTNILTSKALFTKKFAWPQNRDNCLLGSPGSYGEFHAASFNVHEGFGDIAMREDRCSRGEPLI